MRLLLTFAAAMMLTACGANNVCTEADDDCLCTGSGICSWTCPDGNCAFGNSSAGDATFECDAGGCQLSNAGQGTTTLNCAGGNCTAGGASTGTTIVNCAGGNCTVACDSTGTCIVNHCADCVCEETLTAVCEVNGN